MLTKSWCLPDSCTSAAASFTGKIVRGEPLLLYRRRLSRRRICRSLVIVGGNMALLKINRVRLTALEMFGEMVTTTLSWSLEVDQSLLR